MDEEKKDNKGKVVEFKPRENPTENDPYLYKDEIPEINVSQYFELPEDFIKTEENINTILTLMGIYKLMGLDEDAVQDAAFMFVDIFGDLIDLVPERNFDDDDDE